MTALAGLDEIAQTTRSAPRSGPSRLSDMSADPALGPLAISFKADWQSQLAGLAIGADSDGSERVESSDIGNAQMDGSSERLGPEAKQGALLLPPFICNRSSASTQPQQISDELRDAGRLINRSVTTAEDRRKPEVKPASGALTTTVRSDKGSRAHAPNARELTNVSRGQAIDCIQATLQFVQPPGLQNLASSSSPLLALSGLNEQPIDLTPGNSPAQASADGDSKCTDSNLISLDRFRLAGKDAARSQPELAGSSRSRAATQTEPGSRSSIPTSFGSAASAQTSADPSNAPSTWKQESNSSASSALLPSHQLLSKVSFLRSAQNAEPVASQQEASESKAVSIQWLNQYASPSSNGSEGAGNETTGVRSAIHESAKMVDSKSNSLKLPAHSSATVTAHSPSVAATTNAAHVSLERTNDAGLEMTSGTAPTQRLSDSLEHTIDPHRLVTGHAPGEMFSALDSGTSIPSASLGFVSTRRAEAGFQDSSLGWIGIRAEINGGAVHATISGSSPEAAQALGGHIAGLGAYLAENRTPVETLTLASPDGSAYSGFGASPQEGHREADQQGRPDSGQSGSPPETQTPGDRRGFAPVVDAREHVIIGGRNGGTYISLMA